MLGQPAHAAFERQRVPFVMARTIPRQSPGVHAGPSSERAFIELQHGVQRRNTSRVEDGRTLCSTPNGMAKPLLVTFEGGASGDWGVVRMAAVVGGGLEPVSRLQMIAGPGSGGDALWRLRGVTSNERYVERHERTGLVARQERLGRHSATCAALIPIRKREAWWELTQDERRSILEDRSHHIATGLEYLPAVARRLHHSRDLGEEFDFLTWFEYAPEYGEAFEELVARLRSTPEWDYVEREIDIRLER